MKKNNILLLCALYFVLGGFVYSQSNFKIVFVARTSDATNSTWFSKIRTNWKATGISLRALWGDIETSKTVYTWTNFDAAVDSILKYNLDIYIRVSMGFHKPSWVASGLGGFVDSDFQYTATSKYYYSDSDPGRNYPLNFVSDSSRANMKRFFKAVMDHIIINTNTGGKWANKKSCFKEFTPSFSPEEETEYPYGAMCGYSTTEITAFRQYLQTIYTNIDTLKNRWGAGSEITSFSSITPASYHWEDDNVTDTYPKGRTDWINFRTSRLANFINELAIEAHSSSRGFKIGVNFGSIYDNAIEKRGWVDPTLLVQNVDVVHVADIPKYHESFNFGADYLRSTCKFWNKKMSRTSNPIQFTTEINWPGYTDGGDHTGQNYWDDQLNSYYNKGAHEVYLYGWWIHDASQLLTDTTTYHDLYTSIKNHVNQAVLVPNYNYAVHLGCEQVLQNHNVQISGGEKFTIHYSLLEKSPYAPNGFNYHEEKDIVTNKMIAIWPQYLNEYDTQKNIPLLFNKNQGIDGICFTEGSKYITDTAYVKLMDSTITPIFRNTTWFLDGTHGEFAHTQGIYNEYNVKRSPIHLIWRSRPDLIQIWRHANIPEPGSGHTEDFITWAYYSGCGYANPNNREYPEWEILDNGSPRKYIYDKNIRAVWNSRTDLQTAFPGTSPYLAHYSSTPNWNMISWAISNGYSESSLLVGYNYWPYIGNNRSFYKISTLSESTNDSQLTFDYLLDNYPNPFNPSTTINYSIKNKTNVLINVYNILGENVASLVDEIKEPGFYNFTFDGSKLSSGVYIYTLQTSNTIISKKMLLMK